MNVYKIYFFGLICHIGDDERFKKYAAMVRDEDHFPAIIFEHDAALPRNIDTIAFKLGGIPTQYPAETDNSFRHFVPSLYRLIGGSPKQELKDSAILVEYPSSQDDDTEIPSRLSVGQLYEKQGLYRRATKVLRPKDCVARLTELTVTSQYDKLEVITVDKSGTELSAGSVGPGACIVIANISYEALKALQTRFARLAVNANRTAAAEQSATTHHAMHASGGDHSATASLQPGHVNKYGAILDNDQPDIVVDEFDNCPHTAKYSPQCPWVTEFIQYLIDFKPIIMTAVDLECGNTNWP